MPRTKPIARGIPAAALLAGGITRHGSSCACAYCAPDVGATRRQAIPVVKSDDVDPRFVVERCDAGVLQPPVRSTKTIDEVFDATRAAVTEHVGGDWSPAQHVRRAS